MDNRNTNKHKSIIKTIFFIIILIIIVFLFLRGCNKNIINDGIKIVDIKQSVDSFNNDTIFLNENLNKDKRYSYDITIHNYLDEDYYLYKVEIDNNFISYDKLLKLLKSNKDTKFRFNITPKKKINKKVKIKFYYGKLKEIKIGEDIVTFFGDEKVQLPLGEVKEGYRFLGYTDVEGSTKVKYEENKKYDIKDGTTLYPIYKEDKTASNPNTGTNSTSNNNNNTSEQPKENKKYIVTFDYQNGKEKTTKEVTYNEKYGTLPTAIKNGYAFTGWYLDDKKITSDSIVTITKDEILKAKYIIINYGISYDLQGGTVSSNPDSYTTESNDITLLNPSKSGYVFVGWTGSNGTTPEKNVVIKKGSTGSKNYKANFSANEIVNYKVIHKKEKLDGSFDIEEEVFSAPYGSKVKPEVRSYEGFTSPSKNELIVKEDGTSEIEYEYMRNKYTFTLGDNENVISSHTSGEYPYETSITLTAKEKNGYTFKKWSDGQTENPITFSLTEDISISPIYEANKYIVVFDSNTGIGTMPAQEMTYDQVQRLNLNAFTKVGNRFVGWNTKANGEGTAYLDGELVKNLVTEGSITLYAQYILEQYTISFDTDGGDELFNTTRTYGETYGTLPEAQKTGYTFIGWYLGDNKIESSTVVDITENITLKARYTIKNYNISYDLKDGSVSIANPQTYTVEDEFTLNNPSKQGYEFAGWTGTGLEGLTTSVKINKGTTEDLSFAANYTAGTATPYKVIHKYQNYNLTTYTEEEQSLTGVTGTTVYPQIRHKDGFIDPEVTSVQIKADGTTRLEYTYQRDSYTYSFDSNVTSSKEAGTYLYETEITVTPKEKAGYTFKEWEDVTTSNPRTISLSSNTSVVPIYEANKYNVIFNSNTGTGSMPAQEMTYDAESNLIKNTFAKVGYTFVGWNTEDDGEGTPYSDEASVKNLAESGNVILYAQWIANTNTPYKVIHKYQNLDLETYTEEVENKTGTTDAQVTPSVKSKTGFVNPSTQTVTINGNGLTEIIYTYNRETHTYALGNTTNVTSSLPTGNYPYGTEITITANEVPGYTFDKWSDNNTDNPREITLTDDITLSPIYTANTDTTYKVIHRYQNLDSTTYTEEVENKTGTTDTQVTPSVKSKTGFVNPSTQTVIINGNGLTEVIYNYTRETYTFTLEDTENVTSSVPAGNYPYGTEITLTANEIPGYTFDKWNDECTDNPRTITLVGNTTLKPTYTANTNTSYTVHHNKQNITLGGYVLSETDNLTGTTDTKVTPNVKDYEGFTAPVPTEVTIKGDGTTVVEYNYTRNEYTFTLNGAEDVVSTLPSGNYPYETSITLTAQAKVGYNFAGWSDGCEDNPRTISLVGNVELSPVYTNRTDTTYTVIYETMNLDGETYSEYRKDVLTGETGSKVTPEVITITGFTKPTAQEITIKADGTASLEYKYTRNKYSFAYSDTDDIDLDNSTPSGNYYYETEITVKAKEKEGYAFKDWSNGDSVNPTTFILDDAKTISAYYEANKYNVVFNANTGTGSMEDQEMTYDTESNLTKNTFIKEGYTFAGWNTDPYGEGTSYEDEAPVENLATSGNIILYAQWVEYPEANYTVYHYKQNLELDDYDLEYEEELSGITNAEVTPEVYDYEGFNSPETQTVTIAADGSTEVYYYYTRKMYTFEIENSEFISSSHENGEYPYETEIEINANEKAGYTFESWSNGETSNPLTIMLDSDIEITAIYSANTDTRYTVYHYKQNLELDDYDLEYEEELSGITNEEVTPEVYDYEGFNSPETQTVTIAADGSTEVYYYYTRKMYTFEIIDSEYVHSSHENGEYPYETEIEINADEIPRYTFMRWSDGNTDNPRMITLDEDMNISAEYHLTEPYEVTFDSNGGEGDMDSLIYERDTTYNLPSNEFTNSSYIFAGWNTESDGTGIDYYDGESVINITEEDSVTLYALWAEEQYVAQIGNDYYTTLQKAIDAVPTTKVETTVKLLKDTSETITIANTKNVVLNLQNLTLSNSGNTNVIINNGILKIYNGNITSDASQGVINNNSGATLVMSGGRIIMTGNRQGIYNDGGTLTISGTAYIRSDSNQRAVIHNKSNGTVNITGGEIVSTQHYAIYNEKGTMNIGTKDGIINNETPIIQGKTYGIVANSSYNFYDGIIKGITNPVGKTSNTGNTPTVSLDTNETKINELENNSAKIHGTEEIDSLTYKTLSLNKDSITYKITFDANGGNSSVSEKTVIITESIGELPTPTREGYTFIGWFENLLTGVKIESSYIPTSNMTLIAKYYKSIENATITPSKIIIDVGEEETINVTNIEEEYSFRSINPEVATVDQSGKITGVSKGTTTIEITGSTSGKTATISVKVLQNHYTISFETDGGTPVEDIRIEQGESIGNLPETKKKGYTFDGWYKESTYNTKIDSSYTPTEDTRLYALWIMNPYPTFKTGSYINAKMKQLAGQSGADYSTSNSSITSILRSETKPNDSVLIDDNIVSTDDSIIPIYMWYDDNTIYYYSDAITIYLNPDSSHMFQYVTRLTNLDSSSWDTSKVTDMSWMFCECQFSRSLDLSNFDTRNVTDMRGIFSDCWYLQSLNISTWNTSKVTNMMKMFWNCSHIKSLDLSSFDTRNVTDMAAMFASCNELTYVNLSSFDTRNVTDMYNMFIYCNKLTILDLSSFDTSNVEDMGNMFYSCKELTTIYASDKFVTDKVYSENVMFGIANKIVGGAGTTYNPSKIGTEYARIDDPDNGKPGYFTSKNKKYTMFKDGYTVNNKMKQLAGANTNFDSNIVSILRTETKPDDSILIDDNKVSIEGSAYPIYMWYDNRTIYYYSEAETLYLNQDSSYMFNLLRSLTTIDISNLDTSKVINMSDMFSHCESLTTLDLSSFDTSNVTNMSGMFQESKLLRNLNLSNLDTSKVINMSNMFSTCESLTTLNLSNFDTLKVEDMSNMFRHCESLTTLDLSSFDTSNVTDMSYMFQGSKLLRNLNLSNLDTSKVIYMFNMFSDCESLTTLDLSSFDTSNVEYMGSMFYRCKELTTIYASDKFVTNIVSHSGSMFYKSTRLVGGSGTAFDDTKIDKEYARIDDPANGNPGYFTEKIANNSNSLSENSSPKRGVDESNINSSESVIKTITFNSNGGIGDMVTQEFDINSDIVININTFTNTGEYEFIGWNTEPDGTGIGYTDGDTILSNTYNDNIILYAQWQINGWVLINKEYIDTISLEEQEWAYYNHGVRIENGFHVLPDLSGTDKLYNISNGIAQLGWIEDQDNNWFYFSKLDTNGDGYIDLDAYVDGDYIIDEITYRFDENGICLNHDGSSLSASVSTFTNNNFKIPLEAYSLRRYFMGIVY